MQSNPLNSRCSCKTPRSNSIIYRPLKGFCLHTQREDRVNTSCQRPPQRNRRSHNDAPKVKVRSQDKNTDYSDIVSGVPQGDTLALHLFIICLD